MVAYRICLVCSGNICRSPTAEVVLRSLLGDAGLADEVTVGSAGIGGWHVGERADPRSLRVLAAAGYDGSSHRVRQFDPTWFDELDLVLALDRGHLDDLRALAPDTASRDRVLLLRSFDPAAVAAGTLEVEDPYFGAAADFERVLREIEAACAGLVEHLDDTLVTR